MTPPTDLPVLAFPDQAAFEAWLEAEHATAPGLYVKLAKKGAGVPSVTYAELVESCLCFGWIDGRSNRLDDRFYLQRITPRRARSVWSQKNVDAVEALTRSRPDAARRARRRRGRPRRRPVGAGLRGLGHDHRARRPRRGAGRRTRRAARFEALDGTNRYAVLWRVHTAATPGDAGQADRGPVQMLAEGRRIH